MPDLHGGNPRRGVIALGLLLGLLVVGSTAKVEGQGPGTSGAVIDAQTITAINEMIQEQWKANSITPSKAASEHEWLRRVYLDIVGRIPTVDEIQAFRRRPDKGRREEEIKYLLQDPDYAKNWANLWTVWLLTRNSPPGVSRETMRRWLEDKFSTSNRHDKLVEELLTATGKANENGATNFVLSHMGEQVPQEKRNRDGTFEMVPVTSRSTKLFLGVQTQCTQCHDHPFIDNRKQQQYWGINAFLRQTDRDPDMIRERRQNQPTTFYTLKDDATTNSDPGIFFERRNGLLLRASPTYFGKRVEASGQLSDRQQAAVKSLFDKTVKHYSELSRRQQLALEVILDDNFAKAFVNRMWGHFFGRGFTNPVDDFGEHDPVSHPELLDRLAKDFVASGYDQRRLMEWICRSHPYQLSSVSNKTNEKQDAEPYFSRMLLKAMTPEQLVDSISTATAAERSKNSRADREALYARWLQQFTVNFGDDEGNEATFNGTVVQALMMMNGNLLNEAVKPAPGSTLQKALALNPPPLRLQHIYLAALSRPPTSGELQLAHRILAAQPTAGWQDIFWALLNSNEFILNH